jgi:hypothetical protein
MHPNNQSLPVNPTQIDGASWIPQGLPHQPPFVPSINAGQLQPLLPLITGMAILVLQNNAQKNPLRTFNYNLCARNQFQNEDFQSFLGAAIEYSEFIIATQRMPPEQAVEVACEELGAIFVALNARKYPALGQYIHPQLKIELDGLMQRFEEIRRNIDGYQKGAAPTGPAQHYQAHNPHANAGYRAAPAAPTYGYGGSNAGWNNNWAQPRPMNPAYPGGGGPAYGGGAPGYGAGYPAPAGYGAGPATGYPGMPMGGHGYGQPRPGVNMSGNNLFVGGPAAAHNPLPGSTPSFGMGRRKNQVPPPPSGTMEEVSMGHNEPTSSRKVFIPPAPKDDYGQLQPVRSAFKSEVAYTPPAPEPMELPEDTFVSVGDVSEYPKVRDLSRPYDAIQVEEGVELRPAFKSGWKLSFNEENPYPTLYDPTTHILFHLRKADGKVVEIVKARQPDMNYLDNEIDPKLRAQQRTLEKDGKTVVPNHALVVKMRPHPKLPISTVVENTDEEGIEDVSKLPEPVVVENAVQGHSLQEVETKVSLRLPEGEHLKSGRNPVEYYADLVTPVEASPNEIATIKSLAGIQNFEEFKMKLLAAQTQEQISFTVFDTIDNRLANAINVALAKNMNLPGWSIESFIEDFVELCQMLTETYSKNLVETFKRHAAEIIASSVSVLSGDAFAKYLKAMGIEDHQAPPKVVVFRERCSVTHVPWDLETIMATVEDGGMVKESEMPNLYAAVKAIMVRTSDQTVPFAKRFLATNNGEQLEIRKGFFGVESYLLYKVSNNS